MIYYDFFQKDQIVQAESLKACMDFIKAASYPGADFKRLVAEKNLKIRKLTVSLKNGLTWEDSARPRMPGLNDKKKNRKMPDFGQGQLKVMNNQNQAVLDRVNAHLRLNQGGDKNIEDAKKWYDIVIEPLEKNEVTSMPLNQDESWLVARYLGKNAKGDYELEVVSFQKLNFGEWLEKEKAKVHIKINDKKYQVPL